MLSNFKWMMAKNDPSRLLSLYGESPAMQQQVIDRLLELNETHALFELAMRDGARRLEILTAIMNDLDLASLLTSLNYTGSSPLTGQLIKNLSERFSTQEIRKAVQEIHLDRNVRKALLQEVESGPERKASIREDYLKLRILVEEIDFRKIVDDDTPSDIDIGALENNQLTEFLKNRGKWNPSGEFDFFRQILSQWCRIQPFNRRFNLALLAISGLHSADRVRLVKECRQVELYYPENFQLLTDSAEIHFETFSSFFAPNTISAWMQDYLLTQPIVDLLALSRNLEPFAWLQDRYPQPAMLQKADGAKSEGQYLLTSKFGYQMSELLNDPEVCRKLLDSCGELRESIIKNLANDSFPLEKYIRPLIWIGGAENIAFLSNLMNRRVVENYSRTIQEIELNYSHLKKRIDDSAELAELVRSEISEKANLIPIEKHRLISSLFFRNLTFASHPSDELIRALLANLPMLEQYAYIADEQNRIQLCRFIGILKLTQHASLLKEFLKDENPRVAIQAAVTLMILQIPDWKDILTPYIESTNYLIRKQLLDTICSSCEEPDEEILMLLARDAHLEVCRAAYDVIAQQPVDKAIRMFRQLLSGLYHRNVADFARALGKLGSPKSIPLLVEILADAEADEYLQVIRALANTHHRVSLNALNLLDLRRNPYLEIERAQAMVQLGDPNGWKQFEKYLNLPSGPVTFYARIAFLLHGSGEFLPLIREFSFDPDPVVSVLAAGKLFLYREEEGWETLQRLVKTYNPEVHYYLALLFHYLPFQRVKGSLFTLWQQGDFAVKTVAALIFADNGLPNYLSQLDHSLPLGDVQSMAGIIRALGDHPTPLAMPILRRICQNYQSEGIDEAMEILLSLDASETLRFAMNLWKKPFDSVRIAVAKVLGKVADPRIIPFIRKHIDLTEPTLKAEMAYALLVQGDEAGWEYFSQLLASTKTEAHRVAIEQIARLNRRESYDLLVRHLGTAGEALQSEILKALGTMQIRESVPLLAKYIMHPSGKLRIAIAKALGEIGDDASRELLKTLAKDKDEYVRVAVEIAQQKAGRVSECNQQRISVLLPQVFQPTNWRLQEPWFRRTLENFADHASRYQPQPLESLLGKEYLDEDMLENRKQAIQNELSVQLIGCTDVEKIVSAKNEANTRIANLIPKGLLIRSLLSLNQTEITEEQVESLQRWAANREESVHLSLIFASAASSSPRWLPILDTILRTSDNSLYYDPILFSVSRKLHGGVLPLLIRLLHYDRARYYLLFMVNFFLLNPEAVQIRDIQDAKQALSASDSLRLYKESTLTLLNNLLEHKL